MQWKSLQPRSDLALLAVSVRQLLQHICYGEIDFVILKINNTVLINETFKTVLTTAILTH